MAQTLGVDYPIRVSRSATTSVRDLARELNHARRHLDPEQRRRIVASLREKGHSLRAIGGAVGVSKSPVAKDVAELSTSGCCPTE
jgi:transposase-like protein